MSCRKLQELEKQVSDLKREFEFLSKQVETFRFKLSESIQERTCAIWRFLGAPEGFTEFFDWLNENTKEKKEESKDA